MIYIAGSFNTPEKRAYITRLAEKLRKRGNKVYVPMENKIENAWSISNAEWGKAVFTEDLKAINKSRFVYAIYLGWQTNTGTAWELGYCYGIKKPTIILIPNDVKIGSLMILNNDRVYSYEEFIYNDKLVPIDIEQK